MALPANPVLASNIWLLHQTTQQQANETNSTDKKLPLNFPPIDRILNGGFEHGHIHSITSEPEHGAQELVQALITSHLSTSRDATAAIIDSTLAFDVRRLHRALTTAAGSATPDPAAYAMAALSRLQIMQVFDFVGLTESLAEIREALERGSSSSSKNSNNDNNNTTSIDAHTNPSSPSPRPSQATGARLPRATIADSQDDDDDEDLLAGEGEETETAAAAAAPPLVRASIEASNAPTTSTPLAATPTPAAANATSLRRGSLLVIDSLSQVAAPAMKNHAAQGRALVGASLRALALTAREHGLCVVVVGGAAGAGAGSGWRMARSGGRGGGGVGGGGEGGGIGETAGTEGRGEGGLGAVRSSNANSNNSGNISQFASCALRPALGVGLGFLVDTQVYLHAVPTGGGRDRGRGREVACVFEMMQDRHGARTGRWAAFGWDAEGRLREAGS